VIASYQGLLKLLTGIISTDCGLHDGFHPLPNNNLLGGAEEMRFISVVHDSESISSGISILVCENLVSQYIDIPFDFALLNV
jgi:hypothetical protein